MKGKFGAMSDYSEIVQEKQRKRYLMLMKLWEAAGGKEHTHVNYDGIAKEAGFTKEEAQEIYNFFTNEGLFRSRTVDGSVTLSHRAIIEAEQSITSPSRATEHFSSTVIQNFNAPVASVQTGAHSTAYVTQNFGANASDVLRLIQELRQSLQSLPPDEREDAIEVVDALAEEVQLPTPRKGRVKAFLGQIASFTADTASNVIATAIAKSLGM